MEPTNQEEGPKLSQVIQIDEGKIQEHLGEVVRSTVEEALVEMYLAGVSVRRVEDITEALWGTRVSPSTVSELNQKIYGQIESWRNKPLEGHYPYVFLDGLWLKRS